ncbi:MAG: 50S ribosomal protein L1, partial [Candidatus Zixiibacteriota bacterium]
NLAAAVGKLSFEKRAITDNIRAFADAILRAKPATAKGTYVLAVSVSSTMGPGIKLDQNSLFETK